MRCFDVNGVDGKLFADCWDFWGKGNFGNWLGCGKTILDWICCWVILVVGVGPIWRRPWLWLCVNLWFWLWLWLLLLLLLLFFGHCRSSRWRELWLLLLWLALRFACCCWSWWTWLLWRCSLDIAIVILESDAHILCKENGNSIK